MSSHLTKYNDDIPILVEVTVQEEEIVVVTENPGERGSIDEQLERIATIVRKKVVSIPDDALFYGFNTIWRIARKTEGLLNDLYQSQDQSQYTLANGELEFSLKFNSAVEAVVCVGAEANITVKLSWQRKQD